MYLVKITLFEAELKMKEALQNNSILHPFYEGIVRLIYFSEGPGFGNILYSCRKY